jgi:hypothetical protein
VLLVVECLLVCVVCLDFSFVVTCVLVCFLLVVALDSFPFFLTSLFQGDLDDNLITIGTLPDLEYRYVSKFARIPPVLGRTLTSWPRAVVKVTKSIEIVLCYNIFERQSLMNFDDELIALFLQL